MKTRKLIAILLTILMTLTTSGMTAFAAGMNSGSSPYRALDLAQQSGKLMITEPGSYVLTGKLTGSVYVDPGFGEVELILDGVDINGKDTAGVIAVSGELKITLPEGSVSRISDMSSNAQQLSAVYSQVPTTFEGKGSLYVTGSSRDAIRIDGNDVSFNGGAYAVKAPETGINANSIQLNNGHFSIQAQNSFAPNAQVNRTDAVVEEVRPGTTTASTISHSQNQRTDKTSASIIPDQASNHVWDAQRTETPSKPASTTTTQVNDKAENRPQASTDALPEWNTQAENNRPNNMPQTNTEALPEWNTQAESNRPDNMPQMGGTSQPGMNMQPGQQTQLTSASNPTEIVAGTMTNSAAALEADYDSATYITVTDDDSLRIKSQAPNEGNLQTRGQR